MPGEINGFGTAYYGQRAFRPDGSHITTEWFILAYIPLFPLRSLRVIRNPATDVNIVVYTQEGFYVVEKMRPDIVQVLSTYAMALFCALWFALLFWVLFVRFTLDWERYGVPLIFASLFAAALPFFIPLLLRKWARSSIARSPLPTPVPPPLPPNLPP